MSHSIYILKCSDNTLYTGCTNNIDRRVFEHNNSNKGAIYTRHRRPTHLMWFENYPTLREAMRREREIKKMSRKEKLALFK